MAGVNVKYLRYILRHKWFVFVECVKRGIPLLGVIHDWSKFLPSEWIPYVNHFYGSGDLGFDFAWLLHQKRNRHHWQWWVLPEDDGGEKSLAMLPKYRVEMLCDWIGAGRAQGAPDTQAWYEKNKANMRLHPETRKWIEEQITA